MTVQRIVALASGIALTAGALTAGTAQAAPDAAKAEATPVAVSVSGARSITMPTTVQPGVNEFVVTSAKPSAFQVASLAEGYTVDEAAADIEKGLERGKMGALKRFEANTTFFGGVMSVPGKAASLWVDLEPGDYIALDTRGNTSKTHKWATFTAVGADTGATMPEGATVKAKRSAKWANKPASIPNKGTLTFKNRSSSNHFVLMVKMRKGATLKQVKQFLMTEEGAPPIDFRHATESGVLSPGQTLAFDYRLPKGNYAMLCFWPDASMGGMPHAFMGMVRTIKLK